MKNGWNLPTNYSFNHKLFHGSFQTLSSLLTITSYFVGKMVLQWMNFFLTV